jgi:glutathione S-transferase
MIELYYFPDSTCGIKARLALFEKEVEFAPRILDRFALTQPEYLAINPQGVVPTLVHNGEIIVESSVICLYVDDAFEGPPLKPHLALHRARMYLWLKAIDETYFRGIGSITFAFAFRQSILDRHPDESSLENYLQSIRIPEYRERRRSIIALGADAPAVRDAVQVLDDMLAELESTLQKSRFAAGPDYSLADACLAPLLWRLEVFGLEGMWAKRPAVSDWWRRVKNRPSFHRLLEESFPAQYLSDMQSRVGEIWPLVSGMLRKA